MADVKPRTSTGYNTDVTKACEQTLLTVLSAFGNPELLGRRTHHGAYSGYR